MTGVRVRLPLAAALLPLAVAIGCGSQERGEAVPGPSPSSSESSQARPGSKAPPVTEPLEAGKYLDDPCASLTAPQQQSFAMEAGTAGKNEIGVSCRWNVDGGATSVGVSYPTQNRNGLSNVYALNDSLGTGYFEPTEIDGYPAVYQGAVDNRDRGDCGLAVGIRDDLFFLVVVRSDVGNDSCKAAANVASAVIETIKAGA